MLIFSQVLIIFVVDGCLLKKILCYIYLVMLVLYLFRDYNMMEICMILENCNEDDVDDVIKLLKQDRCFKDFDMLEFFLEVLRILSFKGVLIFDFVLRFL